MPPKKTVLNGFSMFMKEQQAKIAKETKRQPSMGEMQNLCAPTWKAMSAAEREMYNARAKEEKRRQRGLASQNHRMDNQGQLIAHRKVAEVEDAKRRAIENQAIEQSFKETDVCEMYFHLIDFQVLYDDRTEDQRYPVEIGVVRFSLKAGIIKFMHEMIDPGPVPQGNTSLTRKHSELTHGIPLNYEHASRAYGDIWKRLEKFLVEDPEYDDIPPLFCLSTDRHIVESCLDFLYDYGNLREPKRINRVYCSEDLMTALIKYSDKVSRTPAAYLTRDAFLVDRWNHTSSIKCAFHAELDNTFCSLSIVRRHSFTFFDTLKDILDFEFTSNHLPDETSMPYTIQQPVSFGKAYQKDTSSWQNDQRGMGDFTVSHPVQLEPQQPRSSQQGAAQYGNQPKAPRQEVHLSDDDYDEEEALYTEEVKSTTDRYSLKELRKPKTASVLQGAGHNIVMTAGRGRGFPTVAGRGMGISQPGMGMPQPEMGMPQPGIGVPQSGIGMPQPGIGVPQSGRGMPQSGIGMPQPGIGVPQSGRGMSHPGIDMPQPGVGVPQSGRGMPQLGRGMPQSGIGMPQSGIGMPRPGLGISQPPPGFAPPPGFDARPQGNVVAPASAWQMNQNPTPAFTSSPPRQGGPQVSSNLRGRGTGRGRGMPPQVRPGQPTGANPWGQGNVH